MTLSDLPQEKIPTRDVLLSYKNFLPKLVLKNYPEFCECVKDAYESMSVSKSISECIYLYFYEKEHGDIPQDMLKCPLCGKPVKFLSFTRAYTQYCGQGCSNKDPKKMEKTQATCKERYGTSNVFASDYAKQKIVETNRKKYGVDYPQQSKEIHAKSKQTCMERYGVEYYSSTQESRQHKSDIKEETNKKVRKTAHDNFLKTHPDVIEFKDRWFTMKCPDPKCDKCTEKTFKIPQQMLYSRHSRNMDTCTNRTPIADYMNTAPELFIQNILEEHNIDFDLCNRQIINPKEVDIYIPSKNIAIECNGVYWHSSLFETNDYHCQKWKGCKNNGVQLLSIWEDWIILKPNIVESLILNKLGLSKNHIGARQCSVLEVPFQESKDFLNNNHIQGSAPSAVRLGLYHDGELVSLMTFGHPRVGIGKNKATESDWELVRFCNKLYTQVNGAASKLFNYFVQNYRPQRILSYASHDISDGGLYKNTLNFKEISETNSTYWYIDKQTYQRFHRYSFRKSELVKMGADPNLTEEMIMTTTEPFCSKYFKIYDSGQTTFLWESV